MRTAAAGAADGVPTLECGNEYGKSINNHEHIFCLAFTLRTTGYPSRRRNTGC